MKYEKRKTKKKTVTFRIDEELLLNFRLLCNEFEVKQVSVIENAMKRVIEDLRQKLEEKENDR